jgi:hypothetical protein
MPSDIFDRLEVIEPAQYSPLPKPTSNDLDAFEKASGLKLPKSFREFALRFGAGELAGYYRLAVPLPVHNDYDLAHFNQTAHGPEEDDLWEGTASPEVIKRLVFFGATIGGEMYAWDPMEIRDTKSLEYAILYFPQGEQGIEVAGTFSELLENVWLKPKLQEDGWIPELEFCPFLAGE